LQENNPLIANKKDLRLISLFTTPYTQPMSTIFTPFYEPRVLYIQSDTIPTSYFAIVLVDLIVPFLPPEGGSYTTGCIDIDMVIGADGNLTINCGDIITELQDGYSIATFYVKPRWYENMPTDPYPTVTFAPQNAPPSTGSTHQPKIVRKPGKPGSDPAGPTPPGLYTCRPYVLNSLSNPGLYLVGALVDVYADQTLSMLWNINSTSGSEVGQITVSPGGGSTSIVTLYTSLYQSPPGYVTGMQLVDPQGVPVLPDPPPPVDYNSAYQL
jgi:hypothetical protein